jgi:hypothetical protein
VTQSNLAAAGSDSAESLRESALARTRRTFRSVVISSFFYVIWVAVFTLGAGAVGAFVTSADDYRPLAVAVITLLSGLVGLVAGLATAFPLIWLAAPRSQRDEARQEVDRLRRHIEALTVVEFRVDLAIEGHEGQVIDINGRLVTDIYYLSAIVVNEGPTSDFEARIPRTEGLPESWGATYHVMQPQWEHTSHSITTIGGGGSGGRRRLMIGVVAMKPREFWFNTVQTGAPQAGLQLRIDEAHPGGEHVIEFDLEVVNTQHDQVVSKICRVTIPVTGSPTFEQVD